MEIIPRMNQNRTLCVLVIFITITILYSLMTLPTSSDNHYSSKSTLSSVRSKKFVRLPSAPGGVQWMGYDDFVRNCSSHKITTIVENKSHDFINKAIHIVTSHCVGFINGSNLNQVQTKRTEDAKHLLKSAVFMTQSVLHIHVITDHSVLLVNYIKSWPKSALSRVKFSFYEPCFPEGNLKGVFRLCSTQRLFIPYIIQSLDKVIYTDTDSIFLGPPDDVWRLFNNFTEDHYLGMIPESLTGGWYFTYGLHIPHVKPYGMNAGILLMNIKNMRNEQWYTDIFEIVRRHVMAGNKAILGDQDYLNEYTWGQRYQLLVLPCTVNYRTDFRVVVNKQPVESCKEALAYGISILHGNREIFHTPNNAFSLLYNNIGSVNWDTTYKDYITSINTSLAQEPFKHIYYKSLQSAVYGNPKQNKKSWKILS